MTTYKTDIGILSEDNIKFLYKMGILNKYFGIRNEAIGDVQLWSIFRTVFESTKSNNQGQLAGKKNRLGIRGVIDLMSKACGNQDPRSWLLSVRNGINSEKMTKKEGLLRAFDDI